MVLSAPLAKNHAAGTATTLANVILGAPLTKAHASGAAVANPRPLISAATAAELEALLAEAEAGRRGRHRWRHRALEAFRAAVSIGNGEKQAERAAPPARRAR